MRLLHEVLRTVEFLSDGPPELAAEFMGLGRARTFTRNHVLWRAGQSPESVVIPVTGELAALGRDSGGRGICYAFFGTGECVGVPAAVDGLSEPREVRVIRGGDFFTVDRRAFLRFLEGHQDVRARVTGMIGRLFRRSLDERDREVFLPVHARVARFLLEYACARRSDGARILVRESQPEIAIRLGSVREVIAREMAGFGDQGLIRRTRHALFIVDWAGLWAKAVCAQSDSCDCRCEVDTAALRTKRFFLPVLDGGPDRIAAESLVCGEYLTEFRACVARGCPLALAAQCGASSSAAESPMTTLRTQTEAGLKASTNPVEERPEKRASAALDRLLRRAHVDESAHPIRNGTAEDATSRSPAEEHEIRRRVEIYRRRVSGIESKFGGADGVPEDASMFSEP